MPGYLLVTEVRGKRALRTCSSIRLDLASFAASQAVVGVLRKLGARLFRRFLCERSRDFTICWVLFVVSFTSAGEGGADSGTRTDSEGGTL